VATAQGGVVSLDQLRDEGVSRQVAAERAEASVLHRVHRGVYAVGHRSISRATHLRAALLACGEGAVISHATAAAFWGLYDEWPQLTDVTVPVEAGRKIDGIRCRRCRYPLEEEITIRHGVCCTTVARTLVDLAGIWSTSSLRRAVGRAAFLKQLDVDALDLAIHNAKRRRGMRILSAIAGDWRTKDGSLPDVRSDFEALALPQLMRIGLLRPETNVRMVLEGEVLEVDFLWEKQRLVVETDGGGTHETPAAFQQDRHRDQLLVAAGYRVMRVTWKQMHSNLEGVVSRISRALKG
jgi:very-short-patch-repair endonuclease